MKEKILLVDDDTNILASYRRNLRTNYEVYTAENAADGIYILQEEGPFAVVVSDYRMPGVNGIMFLAMARKIAPNTVRIILTGQAEMQVAIDAVNNGNLFRFLTKPCPTYSLMDTLTAAIEQYKLIRAEQELLERTLKGSIRILIDILTIVSPLAFSRSSRAHVLARRIAKRLNEKNSWEIELAAMLSQIGCVTIPNEILKKKYRGEFLPLEEIKMFNSHPQAGKNLMANIPRLGGVAEAIAYQLKKYDGGGIPIDGKSGKSIPLAGRILKVILDYDEMIEVGKNSAQILEIMYDRFEHYDPDIVAALEAEILSIEEGYIVRALRLRDITVGMILADDMRDKSGALLLQKGQEFTEIQKIRLMNYARMGIIIEPIRVLERTAD